MSISNYKYNRKALYYLLMTLGSVTIEQNALCENVPEKLKKNESFVNQFGIKMTAITPGTFLMGSPETEKSRGRDEGQVNVEITQAFWIGETELTQGQWKKVMELSLQQLIDTKIGALGRGAKLKNSPSVVADAHPMCFVSYSDALKF